MGGFHGTRRDGRKEPVPGKKKASRRGRGGGDPQAEYRRAVSLHQAGNHRRAAKIADALAKRLPNVAAIRHLQGAVAIAEGKLGKAVDVIRKGLAADGGSAALNDLLGVALVRRRRHDEAVKAHKTALAAQPGDPKFLNNLGNALRAGGRLEEARDAYRQSLERRPDHPDTLSNLGIVLIDLEDYENAQSSLQAAAERAPHLVDVHVNLAYVFMERHRMPEAIDASRRALELEPSNVDALNNLGRACMGLGRHDEAEAAIRRALDADPRHTGSLLAMAIQHFLRGRWAEAWTCHELRWRIEAARHRAFPQPLWSGEPVEGKSLLVWGEQGAGDEILFTSMVPDLLGLGARLILELDPRLVGLYRRSFPSVTCVPRLTPPAPETADPAVDYQSPSGSLGRWLRPDEASFPKRQSFLAADPARVETLRHRYEGDGSDLLVGISWRSANRDIGDEKSMDLTRLAPLARVAGFRLVDLQYGDTESERAAFERETGATVIQDPEIDPLNDLDGFAAQIAAMDLVISVSNTTVHMAGALGIPTWVMLPATPLWRWMMERESSPWYPSVRLFRQTRAGEWSDVVGRVAAALRATGFGRDGR